MLQHDLYSRCLMDTIQQGETYTFSFSVTGDAGLTGVFSVLQYPGETPAIIRSLNAKYAGVLTAAETTALAVGQWFIVPEMTDADEAVRQTVKLYISKGWV